MQTEELFLSNLALIERIIRSTCRRHHFVDSDAEDFEAIVKLKFVEDEFEILRQFEGRSSLPTYLYIVIERLFLDHRDHLWGKWRPSAEAKRLGEIAIELDRLHSRDGLPMSEAIETVTANRYASSLTRGAKTESGRVSRTEVERIALKLPTRAVRVREEGGDQLLHLVPADSRADDLLLDQERAHHASIVNAAIHETLQGFDATDQLILRMRFLDGLKFVTIATSLGIAQKLLYKRVERLLGSLREELLGKGLTESEIHELIEYGAEGIAIQFMEEKEILMTGPSHLVAKGTSNGESRPE